MKTNDTIQRFMFENTSVRGEILHLEEALVQLYEPHAYPDSIKELLSEAVLCTLFIASAFKFSGVLTLQFQSEGALNLLLVKCNQRFELRAIAKYDEQASAKAYHQALEGGRMRVTIQPDSNSKPYQSIVPIEGSISRSLSHYFQQSEQIPTYFYLASTSNKIAGLMLQKLPCNDELPQTQQEADWHHLVTLAETLTQEEMLQLDKQTLLHRLFHEEHCRLFEEKSIRFHCPCTKARMLEAIKILGEEEVMQILSTHQRIDITCEFCQKHYGFDKNDVSYLFHNQ